MHKVAKHRSRRPRRGAAPVHLVPLAQGIFFVAAGLWPLLHLRSFEAVTGPKTDDWLARTMGGMLAVIGGALTIGALERSRSKALAALGIGSALTLGTADVVYVARGRLAPVYLADAAVQVGVLVGWAR